MMGKFVIVFLTKAFVILPIVLGNHFHGYDSYKKYYESRDNGGQLKHPTTALHEMNKESYYDHNKDNSKHTSEDSFGFLDAWQARSSGDNYVEVLHCDPMTQTFCEDVSNYPQDFVNQMIAENSSLLHYAHQDVIPLAPRFDNEEEPLCLSTERLIRPKVALNQKDEWRYILQADDMNFLQSVRIEVCKEADSKCRIIDGFAEGYVTTCKQKYIYRELSAIESGKIVRDYFRLPASCCCHVQFKADDKMAKIRSFSEDIFRPRIM